MSNYDKLFRPIFLDGEFGQINSKLTTNVALEKFGEPVTRDPQLDLVSFYYYGLELHFEHDSLLAYRLDCADRLDTLGLPKSLIESWDMLRKLSYEDLCEGLKRHVMPSQFYSVYESYHDRHSRISFHANGCVMCTFKDRELKYIRWKKAFDAAYFVQVIRGELIDSI